MLEYYQIVFIFVYIGLLKDVYEWMVETWNDPSLRAISFLSCTGLSCQHYFIFIFSKNLFHAWSGKKIFSPVLLDSGLRIPLPYTINPHYHHKGKSLDQRILTLSLPFKEREHAAMFKQSKQCICFKNSVIKVWTFEQKWFLS